MFRYFIFFLLCSLASCSSSRPLKKDKATGLPVAKKLKQLDSVDEGMLRGRHGVMFRVSTAAAAAPEDDASADADCQSQPKDCSSPFFRGSDRRDAKLSYNKTNQTIAEPLQHLVDRLHNSDQTMFNHNPAIVTDCHSTRLTEETENVFLQHVFVYVILREDDGDYHLIVGNGTDSAQSTLLSIEISALPETTSTYYSKLKKVRDQFEAKYQTCGRKNLWEKRGTKALPEISIKGTLFYDMFHARQGKHSGDKNIKSTTFWEIHPATYIKFWN